MQLMARTSTNKTHPIIGMGSIVAEPSSKSHHVHVHVHVHDASLNALRLTPNGYVCARSPSPRLAVCLQKATFREMAP